MGALMDYFTEHEAFWSNIGWGFIKIVVLFFIIRVGGAGLLNRMAARIIHAHDRIAESRKRALVDLATNLIRYTFYFIFLLTILPIFGIQIGALLAGAGVVGIAIVFAAQNLLKDFFNGFFIIFENQYSVGDQVTVNGVSGIVKTLDLRMTSLQVWTGQVEYIPNSLIKQVSNFSKENGVAVIDMNIKYQTQPEQAIPIIERIMRELKQSQPDIVGDVAVLGVQQFSDNHYTIRSTAVCKPNTQSDIERLAKQHIHRAFADG